jgi:hypothetical protein
MATWKLRLLAFWIVAIFSGTGCVAAQSFVPAEHVTGLSPAGGHYAAEYRMEDKQGPFGDAKVWSRGVYRTDIDGQARTVVHVGFVFDNGIEAPLRFDPERLYLEDVVLEDGTIERLRPLRVDADPVIPAGEERELQVLFALPRDVWPSSVLSYRVSWALKDGGRYAQKTPFVQSGPAYRNNPYGIYAYGYYSPFYSPYYYGVRPYYYPSWRVQPRFYSPAPGTVRRRYR